jgi:hypothetical protein
VSSLTGLVDMTPQQCMQACRKPRDIRAKRRVVRAPLRPPSPLLCGSDTLLGPKTAEVAQRSEQSPQAAVRVGVVQ